MPPEGQCDLFSFEWELEQKMLYNPVLPEPAGAEIKAPDLAVSKK